MQPHLIIFGSVSTLVDTSELQRKAFNQAFASAGLDWYWSQEEYRTLLQRPGGKQRIKDYAEVRNEAVDATSLHVAKTKIFNELVDDSNIPLRDGVADTIAHARQNNIELAFASSSSRQNVDAIVRAVSYHISPDVFSFIADGSMVEFPKPSPQIYELVLQHFGVAPSKAIAVEDTEACLLAATQADIATIAFPNANAHPSQFSEAMHIVSKLEPALFVLPEETVTA